MVLETQPAIKALVGVVLVAIARMMDMNEAQRAAAQYGIGDGKPSGPLLTIASAGTGQDEGVCPPRSRTSFSNQTRLAADPWIGQMGLLRSERERERECVCVCVCVCGQACPPNHLSAPTLTD